MKRYEGLFVVRPDLNEEAQKKVFLQIETPITQQGGTLETGQEWGRRPLSYSIQKKKEGFYYLVRFSVEPKAVDALKRSYALNESILSLLITRLAS